MKMKLLVLLAAAGFACTPDVPQNTSATATTSTVAVFNTTTGNIPLPNDIVFQQTAGLPPAQQQLLGAFVAKGGFPSDQDLPITVSFSTQSSGTDGGVASAAPSGLPTSTESAPPGRAKGPPEKPPAMSGAAGLSVVSVWNLPHTHVVVVALAAGGGPSWPATALKAWPSAMLT